MYVVCKDLQNDNSDTYFFAYKIKVIILWLSKLYELAKVLDKEDNWFRRGVKEAINIKRTNSDLNRDRGRHHLPSSYNRLISSRDSSPSGLGHVTSPISQ